jgi:hypothetical protein
MANFDPIKKDFASPDSPGESVLHAGDVRIEEISIISSLA